jgi:hypothetical protein
MLSALLAGWLLLCAIAVTVYCRLARAAPRATDPPQTSELCEQARGRPGGCTMLRLKRCRALP